MLAWPSKALIFSPFARFHSWKLPLTVRTAYSTHHQKPKAGWPAPNLAAHGRQQCRAKRLKQSAIDRIALRIVLGVPLDTDGEARCVCNPDRFDRAVFRRALHDHPFAGFENGLTVK